MNTKEETLKILREYHNCKGQTEREMIAEKLRSEDANIIHRILEFAAKQVISNR